MASFFRQPSYTPSWQQRIFPRTDPDAAFSPTSPPSSSPPTSSALASSAPRTLPDGRTLRFVDALASPSAAGPAATDEPEPAAPSAPPPLYFPGQARRRSDAALPPGTVESINVASTHFAQVQWAHHPTAPGRGREWLRFFRVRELGRAMKGDKERLWDGWPREFGGRDLPPGQEEPGAGAGDEEEGGEASLSRTRSRSRARSLSLSLSLSRPSTRGADSGVALTPRPTLSLEVQHPLYPLYRTRIAELNDLIGEQLATTRAWLAMCEVMDYVWVVALVVALAQGKGKQTGFLKGVEIALVLVILLNGTAVNAVRMRRFALSRLLRQKQRDWSPLPTTLSTTNAQLMRNYLDGDVAAHNGAGTSTESMMPKDRASLRWRMRETEGSYWLSYRPRIAVELITPASSTNPLAYLPVVDPDHHDVAPPSLDVEGGTAPDLSDGLGVTREQWGG
ncbi:hypothetical protein JCM10207_005043 [Rhodosporidiobolus poonsookiae]